MLGKEPAPGKMGYDQDDAIVGSEMAKKRPVLIVAAYRPHEIVTIVPITSQLHWNGPTAVHAAAGSWSGHPSDEGYALVHQVRSVSVDRLVQLIGTVTNEAFSVQVQAALRRYLALK